jgi:MFS family permease
LTLKVLLALILLNHTVKTGSNVTILLDALHQDASPVVVGVLTSLAGVFPMLFAVSIGRLTDRYGARLPMSIGPLVVMSSVILPFLWPGLPALFVASAFASLGASAFNVSVQSTVGHLGSPDDRARNYSWLSMTISAGGILGPLVSGFLIDHAGYRTTFLCLAIAPVFYLSAVLFAKLELPTPSSRAQGGPKEKTSGRLMDLLKNPSLRTIYLLTALHVSAWEMFSFLVPVYGKGIGLSASSIGLILGAFASATFFVRIILPVFSHRFPPLTLIRSSLVLAGGLSVLFPLATSVPVLMLLGFVLGMGLGVTQPLAMSVLHEATPANRTGEAFGLRTAVVNLSGTTTPLIFGAAGNVFGMLPVFWGIAVAVWLSTWALS